MHVPLCRGGCLRIPPPRPFPWLPCQLWVGTGRAESMVGFLLNLNHLDLAFLSTSQMLRGARLEVSEKTSALVQESTFHNVSALGQD